MYGTGRSRIDYLTAQDRLIRRSRAMRKGRGRKLDETRRTDLLGAFHATKWMRFVELPTFSRAWEAMRLDDGDLRSLQLALIENPLAAPVIVGTGGLRKMRFAAARSAGGKSGGVRVAYAVFPEFSVIVLAVAFSKREQANLTHSERGEFRELLARLSQLLNQRKL
ncbi:MAG: hypothetical protein IT450_00225 [Phycisphaerales bacterium]|nr:hypothetical protein [Phycisphaerales bacterium]